MAGKMVEAANEIIEPIISDLDLELYDVKYVKEGKNWTLKVFIDSPHGVDLDMCTRVSERLSEALDENDFTQAPYFLEVSSPGAERPLRGMDDYQKSIGKNVRISTYEAINGDKVFEGKLKAVDDHVMIVTVKDKTKEKDVEIPIDKIAKIRLAVVF